MGTTFPEDIKDSMKECILSIFGPQKDIIDFMKKVGCILRELLPESEYKELHRAEFESLDEKKILKKLHNEIQKLIEKNQCIFIG